MKHFYPQRLALRTAFRTSSRIRPVLTAMVAFGLSLLAHAAAAVVFPRPDPRPVPLDLIDTWLHFRPQVANHLVWEFPPNQELPVPQIPIPQRERTPFRVFEPLAVPNLAPSPAIFPDGLAIYLERLRNGGDTRPLPGLGGGSVNPAGDGMNLLAGVTGFLPSGYSFLSVTVLPQAIPPGLYYKNIYGADVLPYSLWPDWAKLELKKNITHYLSRLRSIWPLYQAYAQTGFTVKPQGFDQAFSTLVDFDPTPVLDPPMNLQPQLPPYVDATWTKLPSRHAFDLYAKLAAAQIAMAMGEFVNWRLEEFPEMELAQLFDGRNIFRFAPAGKNEWEVGTATGHLLVSSTMPAPPWITLSFICQNGLIRETSQATVMKVLEWGGYNLGHTPGGTLIPAQNGQVFYYGYNGAAPLSKIINGTEMPGPVYYGTFAYQVPGVQHWVGGCGVISSFNQQILRLMNLPCEVTVHGHFQNRFSFGGGKHAGTGHADDALHFRDFPEIPITEVLIEDALWQKWFVEEKDPARIDSNVGRNLSRIYIQYLPKPLLRAHCQDINWWGYSHADSTVYRDYLAKTYTLAELEAMGLWERIEQKINDLGGCDVIGYY